MNALNGSSSDVDFLVFLLDMYQILNGIKWQRSELDKNRYGLIEYDRHFFNVKQYSTVRFNN